MTADLTLKKKHDLIIHIFIYYAGKSCS